MLKRNETLSSLTWEMLARKNIKNHKRLVLSLEALYLVKNRFCLYFSPIPKLRSRKKSHFKVFIFWRYSKTLSSCYRLDVECHVWNIYEVFINLLIWNSSKIWETRKTFANIVLRLCAKPNIARVSLLPCLLNRACFIQLNTDLALTSRSKN